MDRQLRSTGKHNRQVSTYSISFSYGLDEQHLQRWQ